MNITVISAGAGSGKTYTLTSRLVDMLHQGVRPAGIMATTFTKKAAAELQERVRVRLLETGLTEAANELGEALIGTVHSIGVRLLQRFAFEAGVSPLVEIIADGDEQRLFNESLAQVLTEQRIETLNRLADRLGLTKRAFGDVYDWRRDIRALTDVARANNFSRDILEQSKRRSWETFERLLPPVQTIDAVTWNNRLIYHLEQTVAALDDNPADDTKKTREAAEVLRGLQNQLKWRGELYWHEWVKIAKTDVAVKSRELFQPLKDFALSHDEHPQFRADIKGFTDLIFDVATDALGEYEHYKRKRGLIDYTDMECYVSRLLRIASVRDTLRTELDLLLVDEFQDTSPIQLDIFLQLSRLAKNSIWVGDPKQSIYGFRGAEPALMQAIIRATGGISAENILKKSWRSRADLVYAANAIFTRAFPDLPVEQVVLEPAQVNPTPGPSPEGEGGSPRDKQTPLPFRGGAGGGVDAGQALIHWHFRSELDERKVPGGAWLDNCIAEQVGVLLERQLPVFSKKRDRTRPVQPGDIAILCRSNKACLDMAAALHRAGLRAAIARAGLLDTPEAKLVLAGLKYLLTPSDALSIAELLLLTGSKTLAEMTDDRLAWLNSALPRVDPTPDPSPEGEESVPRDKQTPLPFGGGADTEGNPGRGPWASDHPFIRQLAALRPHIVDLSASEILNLLLDEMDLRRIVAQFGYVTQRLDNVDRLRGLALEYESACQRLHSAASLGGFLLWLNALAGEELDMQGSGESPDAVKVLTYHKSKGLEYPVTICHQLAQALKEKVWGLNLVSEVAEPDLDNILGGRWLRFWINPYGDQARGTRLDETLRESPEWAVATRQALDEEARLLYVGFTRARDYVVFPTTTRGTPWLNRVFSHGDETITTLDPNSDETPFYHAGEPLRCATELLLKPRDFPEAQLEERSVRFHGPRSGRHQIGRAAWRIDPYAEIPPGFECHLGELQRFAPELEFKGEFSTALGKTLNAILFADGPGMATDERVALVKKQLEIRQIEAETVAPAALARQSAAWGQFLEKQFGPATVWSRFPLQGNSGKRFVELEVDFLLEKDDQIVLLQSAGFAEGTKKWKIQAQAVAPALGWARRLARQAWPEKNVETWVFFPVDGQAVRLEL